VLRKEQAASQSPLDRPGTQPDRDQLITGHPAALMAGDRGDPLIARAENDDFVARSEKRHPV
jgi:hypothetical protein